MLRIDFHILKKNQEHSYQYLARLVEKVYLLKKNIFIYTQTQDESKAIDELLWTFQPASFLPHCILDIQPLNDPILISHAMLPDHKEVLVNLSSSPPSFFNQFTRIIEPIPQDLKEQGRDKFRHYQNSGCQIHTFHIN